MRAQDDTWGHYQDNRVQWFLDDPGARTSRCGATPGSSPCCTAAGAGGTTCACDAQNDGVTNPPAINGNTDDVRVGR